MKKNITIFLSFILALVILFVPDKKVLAWSSSDYININYNNERVNYYVENYSDFLNFMDEKLKEYISETGYKYIVYFGHNNNVSAFANHAINYSVVFYENTDSIYMRSYNRSGYLSGLQPWSNTYNPTYLFHTYFDYEKFVNNEYFDIENLFEQNKLTSWSASPYFITGFGNTLGSYNGEDIFDLVGDTFYFPYDTNANLIFMSISNQKDYFLNVSFDGGDTVNSDGDIFLTYKDYSEINKEKIIISSGLACPIPNYDNDPQAEIITVDFSNIYSENYKYYYSYDTNTKYELNVTSDNLIHTIIEYLYSFMYFYVYDENDNLIYYTYKSVDERLGFRPDDYEERKTIKFETGPACDLNGNEVINVRFDFSNITKYINHYNFDVVINGEHLGAIQYYDVTLDSSNYLKNLNYEVEIYIDTWLYKSEKFSIGDDSSSFDDMYNDILNDMSSSNIDNNKSLFDLFVGSLNHFENVIIDIFDNCTYIFNNLSPTLKYFYISVFILILFGFLIKFIL